MANLKAEFEQAALDVQGLTRRPDDKTLLRLYALYKQATGGDVVEGSRPTGFDIVGKAKYDAWVKLKGTDSDSAMRAYIVLVEQLQAAA